MRILMDREGELQLVFVWHFTREKSVRTLHKVVLKNLHYILVTQEVKLRVICNIHDLDRLLF